MALMAFLDSELNKSEFDLANYKRGLASVEEQLVFYKKNEVVFCDQIAVLKRDASYRDLEITALNAQVENLKKEKEVNKIKIDSFENASKSLDKLIGSQISENNRKGVGFESYNAVAPPPTGLFSPPTIDLSNAGLEEFQKPEFEGYGLKVNKSVSDSDEDECEAKETDNFQHKPEQAYQPRKMVQKPVLKNEQNGTGQREVRPVWNNAMRTNHQNFSNSRRKFAPKAVLTKFGLVPTNTARQSSSRVAVPVSTVRPINTVAPRPLVNIVNFVNTANGKRVTSAIGEKWINAVKSSACWVWRPTGNVIDHVSKNSGSYIYKKFEYVDPTDRLNGCSRHMTGNKSYLTDYEDYDGGFVAFAGSSKGGKITGKGKIRTGKLDFEDVYFVKELKFNLFSVSQMCDRKNSVLFTESECLILSPEFKLPDENQVMLKIPRKDNMYSFDLKNVVPSRGLTCLFAKATNDESKMWHRRLGHVNFKNINRLVKSNIVRGLPSKIFENDNSCVACQKGKQHKATWIENQLDHKVKIIRSDNRNEFKNYEMNQFCGMKGIKKEFSNARTPQQNEVAERKNRTLIEAARTILAYLLLPITFWAEAVNTACYVQNRVLVTKPYNKTPYELLIGRKPIISFMRPFGCPITILNTLDHLGKFDGKADEGIGPKWLFDIDSLTNSMNYQPVNAGNRTNGDAGLETYSDARQAEKERVSDQEYILLPLLQNSFYAPSSYKEAEPHNDAGKKAIE
ncbi:ribonuclease H-like domain-containing protein [Tanacetum coccineum]